MAPRSVLKHREKNRSNNDNNNNVDWLKLPSELLVQIAEDYLPSVNDYVAFSCVCRCWRNAIISGCDMNKLRYNWAHHQMPWLLLTDGNQKMLDTYCYYSETILTNPEDELLLHNEKELMVDNGKSYKRSMLNLIDGNTYTVNCPQGFRRKCWGSSHGWIFTQDNTPNLYVFNPLTSTRLNLPSILSLAPNFFEKKVIKRAAIFKVPSDDDVPRAAGDPSLLVVVIYGNFPSNVAFAKPGDTEWTKIDDTNKVGVILDVSYSGDQAGGRLVVLGTMVVLGYCDLDRHQGHPVRLTWYDCKLGFLNQPFWVLDSFLADYNVYLVHRGEDLLLVVRILKLDEHRRSEDYVYDNYSTTEFKVYKFVYDNKQWKELKDLGDAAVFVGSNTTMSVCASDVGCQPNSIYFTDDSKHCYTLTEDRLGGRDMGIFRMADQSVLPLDLKNNTHIRSYYCCPLWFTPTL